MTPALYRLLSLAAGPFLGLVLERRRRAGKEDASRLAERRGIAARPRPPGPLIWLHGASVGEAQSILGLVDRLRAYYPQPHILVTTGTVTAAALLAERLPAGAWHHYVPLDHPGAVRRFLDHWQPSLAVFVESELWPNLLFATARRQVPLALVNGRMSQRSFAGWSRRPGLIRPLLKCFDLILAQSVDDAARFERLGAARALPLGNLKGEAEPLPFDPAQLQMLAAALASRPRWLAASTHDGEEAAAAASHRALRQRWPDLVTVIAPRHPARGEAIGQALAAGGLAVARRSRGDAITAATDVYLVDTLGELGLFYRLCPITFIGGSLVGIGGHNPFEAARLGACLTIGPAHQNCRDAVARLGAAGALTVVADPGALTDGLARQLADPAGVARAGAAAAAALAAGGGITEQIAARLLPLYLRGAHARA